MHNFTLILNYFWQFTYLMLQNQQNIQNYEINRNFSKMQINENV